MLMTEQEMTQWLDLLIMKFKEQENIDQDLSLSEINCVCYQAAREVKLMYHSKWSACIDAYLRYYHGMNFMKDPLISELDGAIYTYELN